MPKTTVWYSHFHQKLHNL